MACVNNSMERKEKELFCKSMSFKPKCVNYVTYFQYFVMLSVVNMRTFDQIH